MGAVIRTFFAALAVAIATQGQAAIPTPAAGTGVPLAAPTPINPVQYNVASGQVGSSAAQNSNFYKVYADLNGVINALNGCSYVPGPTIGTVVATSPIQASLSSCMANTGAGVTLTLSLGIVPAGDLPSTLVYTSQSPSFTNLTTTGLIVDQGGVIYMNPTNTASLQFSSGDFLFSHPIQDAAYNGSNASAIAPVYTEASSGSSPVAYPNGTHTVAFVAPVTVTTGQAAGVLVGSTGPYYFPTGFGFTNLASLVCQVSQDGGGGGLMPDLISKTTNYVNVGLYAIGNSSYTSPMNVDVECTGY